MSSVDSELPVYRGSDVPIHRRRSERRHSVELCRDQSGVRESSQRPHRARGALDRFAGASPRSPGGSCGRSGGASRTSGLHCGSRAPRRHDYRAASDRESHRPRRRAGLRSGVAGTSRARARLWCEPSSWARESGCRMRSSPTARKPWPSRWRMSSIWGPARSWSWIIAPEWMNLSCWVFPA